MNKRAELIYHDHVFYLSGDLDFSNVKMIYEKGLLNFAEHKEIQISS